jgi:hypothetical protein
VKITFDTVELAPGDRQAADGFRISHLRAVQPVEYVRGTYAGTKARGNQRNSITFRVTRVHADLETALEFTLDHPGALPDSGVLHIETNAGTGDRWIEVAVLVQCDLVELSGVATVHAYTLTGGEILTADPTTV